MVGEHRQDPPAMIPARTNDVEDDVANGRLRRWWQGLCMAYKCAQKDRALPNIGLTTAKLWARLSAANRRAAASVWLAGCNSRVRMSLEGHTCCEQWDS